MWPWVIRFETLGHCNLKEGANENTEKLMVENLQSHGYLLLHYGGDTTVVHSPTLEESRGLAEWADKHFTLECNRCQKMLKPSSSDFGDEAGAGYSQWWGGNYPDWYCKACFATLERDVIKNQRDQ